MLKKIGLFIFIFLISTTTYASLIVPMTLVDRYGEGKNLGAIRLDDTLYGLLITPELHDLPAGIHGFDVHTSPFCSNDGIAAGGHLDPERTYHHHGPFRGDGHLGDLPVLLVDMHGHTPLPVLAPRLKLSEVVGHSLIILAGGDNYSDKPLKEYASKTRIACGIIPYH